MSAVLAQEILRIRAEQRDSRIGPIEAEELVCRSNEVHAPHGEGPERPHLCDSCGSDQPLVHFPGDVQLCIDIEACAKRRQDTHSQGTSDDNAAI